MPDVIPLHVNGSFRTKEMEGRELQIADGLNRPGVVAIGAHSMINSYKYQ